MYLGLFVLSIFIVSGASAYHAVLVANNDGVQIVDPLSKENKTVLPFGSGANAVGYDLETGYVYSILKSNQEMQHRIVRTKVLETPGTNSCFQEELEDWCHRDKYCLKICNSSNPYSPEKVIEPYNCSNANNLVLDWINDNIYWTCDSIHYLFSTLNMATTEGLDNKTILTRRKTIQSVDIDPFEGILLFLELNTLWSINLDGGNEIIIGEFPDRYYLPKISLDIQLKTIYIVGYRLGYRDERILLSTNYNASGTVTLHYTSINPALEVGPKIVNSIVYWLALSNDIEWHSVGDSVTEENIKMEKISVPYSVNQWSLVHLDAQKPVVGSFCRTRGCSHSCSLSHWMTITCQCPSGMSLGANSKTCYDEPKMVSYESGITTGGTVVERAVNGSRVPSQSVGEASQNATETAGAVTAYPDNMVLLYVIVSVLILHFRSMFLKF